MTLFQETLPFVSLIVPVRNEEKLIEGCLESLLRQDYPPDRIEIIAVDNGSTDRSRLLIKKYPVRYLLEPRWGAAAARNRGGQETAGEFLAFVDADCVLPENWVSFLVRWFIEHPASMLANGRTLGDKTSLISRYFNFRGRAFFESKESSSRPPAQPPWLITTNLMIRRSIFEEVGGFEESLLPGEDMDLSWRVGLLGHLPKFFPDLIVRERRPYPLLFLWKKSFRAGRAAFFLGKRYAPVFQKTFRPRHGQRTLVRKWMRYFREIFFEHEGLSMLQRLAFLFIGITTHAAFLGGKLRAYIQTEILKVPSPVPVLSAELGRHPLPQSFGLSPEDRLLYLAALHESARPDKSKILEHAKAVVDWDEFLRKAGRHRLGGPVYHLFKDLGKPDFPNQKILGKIKESYYWNQAHLVKIEKQLVSLLGTLANAGIPVLLLKGAALLQTLYKERPCRPFCDLDLLIHRGDYACVKKLLEAEGYSTPAEIPHSFPSQWHRRTLGPRLRQNAVFSCPPRGEGIPLDLHFEVFEESPSLGLASDWIWKDAKPVDVAGARVFLPSPVNQLIHLLLHLVKNRTCGTDAFSWFLDIDGWLRTYGPEIDTASLGRFLETSPLSEQMLTLLALVNPYLFSPLPEGVDEKIRARKIKPFPLAEAFPSRGNGLGARKRSELEAFNAERGWVDRREQFFFLFHRARGRLEKYIFFWRWLFPDSKYLARKYPFKTPLEKVRAFFRHFGIVTAKGVSIFCYGLHKKFASSR